MTYSCSHAADVGLTLSHNHLFSLLHVLEMSQCLVLTFSQGHMVAWSATFAYEETNALPYQVNQTPLL